MRIIRLRLVGRESPGGTPNPSMLPKTAISTTNTAPIRTFPCRFMASIFGESAKMCMSTTPEGSLWIGCTYKRSRISLSEAEDRLRWAFERTPAGVPLTVSPQERILLTNESTHGAIHRAHGGIDGTCGAIDCTRSGFVCTWSAIHRTRDGIDRSASGIISTESVIDRT